MLVTMKVFCVAEKLHAENEFEDVFLGRLLHSVHDFPLVEGSIVGVSWKSKFLQLGGFHFSVQVFSPFFQFFLDATFLHHHLKKEAQFRPENPKVWKGNFNSYLFAHEEFHLSAKHFVHGSLSSQNILRNTLGELVAHFHTFIHSSLEFRFRLFRSIHHVPHINGEMLQINTQIFIQSAAFRKHTSLVANHVLLHHFSLCDFSLEFFKFSSSWRINSALVSVGGSNLASVLLVGIVHPRVVPRISSELLSHLRSLSKPLGNLGWLKSRLDLKTICKKTKLSTYSILAFMRQA